MRPNYVEETTNIYYETGFTQQTCTIRTEHIVISFHDMCRSVALSLVEHYSKPENHGTCFIINALVNNYVIDQMYPEHNKLIYYNFEHITVRSINESMKNYSDNVLFPLMRQFDEIWDFTLENYEYYPDDIKEKYVFMPVRYTTFFDESRNMVDTLRKLIKPSFDVFFAGIHDNTNRISTLMALQKLDGTAKATSNSLKLMIVSGYDHIKLTHPMSMCRFALDYPHYSFTDQAQNVIRIYDLLCLGNAVITNHNPNSKYIDYFDGYTYKAQGLNPGEFADSVRTICSTVQNPEYYRYERFMNETFLLESFKSYRDKFLDITPNIPRRFTKLI